MKAGTLRRGRPSSRLSPVVVLNLRRCPVPPGRMHRSGLSRRSGPSRAARAVPARRARPRGRPDGADDPPASGSVARRGSVASSECSSPPASTHSERLRRPRGASRRDVGARARPSRGRCDAAGRRDPAAVAQQPVGEVEHRVAPASRRSRPERRTAGIAGGGARPPRSGSADGPPAEQVQSRRRSSPSAPRTATMSPGRAPARSTGVPTLQVAQGGDRHDERAGRRRRQVATHDAAPRRPPLVDASPAANSTHPLDLRGGVGRQRDEQRGRPGAHRRDVGEVLRQRTLAPTSWRRGPRRRRQSRPRTMVSVVATTGPGCRSSTAASSPGPTITRRVAPNAGRIARAIVLAQTEVGERLAVRVARRTGHRLPRRRRAATGTVASERVSRDGRGATAAARGSATSSGEVTRGPGLHPDPDRGRQGRVRGRRRSPASPASPSPRT